MKDTIKQHSWIPLILGACASFIITLDSTFMNVSISQVVADLNTDVSTIQLTMSFYTLITAAFMLLSTKLQDIVGKKETVFNWHCALRNRHYHRSNKFKRHNAVYRMGSDRRYCRGTNDTCHSFNNKRNIFR